MIPPLIIWPHPEVKGWDGLTSQLRGDNQPQQWTADRKPILAEGYTITDVVDALSMRHPTDAHAPGYFIPGEAIGGSAPRLNLPALPVLIEQGQEAHMGWVFVDYDRPDHAAWGSKVEAEAWARSLMDRHGQLGGALDSAGWYTTKAGVRLIFRPEEPVPCSLFKAWGTAFLDYLQRATGIPVVDPNVPGMGGWDWTSNQWTRCYRLPFVVRDGKPTDPAVDVSRAFQRALAWKPRGALPRSISAPATATQVGGEGVPPMPVPTAITDGEWANIAAIPLASKYLDKMRRGTPLAKSGARDQTMVQVLASIASVMRAKDPVFYWNILARSIAADGSEGAPSLVKLWGRCRYYAQKEADRAEVLELAKRSPPILYNGEMYYVKDVSGGTYRPPVRATALCQSLERWCLPLSLQTRGENNKPRSAAEYLADYGSHAVHVIAEMGRETSEFREDLNQGTLLEACCVPRPIPAEFDPDVDLWLRALGAGEVEKFLDWLATVQDTSRPTCAVYLEGPPGAGKGMLAMGIASIWGHGATSYQDATGTWNDGLLRCPLVFADESVNLTRGEVAFSASFRSLVAETERPLRRKFMDVGTIRGCPRLLVAGNNGDALKIREKLTQEDLDAISQRILHIRYGHGSENKPGDFLRMIGGRSTTAEWVARLDGSPGNIARHVQWLAENRRVKPGSRFLVEGTMSNFHRDMALSSGINGEILACVAYHLDKGSKIPGIVVGQEIVLDAGPVRAVLVNSPTIRKLWPAMMANNPPSDADVAAALRALSVGQLRHDYGGGNLRYYAIPAESVMRVAELLQIGDPDKLDARIRGEAVVVAFAPIQRPKAGGA